MESGDEDFNVAVPVTKKIKKSAGEEKEKGKKKKEKGSSTKGEPSSASPKRKTPVKKNAKEESKKEKGKGKAKGKGKKQDDDDSDNPIVAEEDEDNENFNPNETSQDLDDEEFESKSKTKSEKKTTKRKKGSGGAKNSDQETILEYLKKQNRPYSLINIFDNLHGTIKKANCQKALDALTDEGLLQAKEFGKATVYLLNQQNIPQVSAEELDKLKEDEKIKKQEHGKTADELKEMNAYLKNLTNQLSNEQLEVEIVRLTEEIATNNKKLEMYESGNYPKISDADMKIAEENKKKFETEYKKRRRMCLDMINSIADSMEQKLTNVIEMIGIDED